MEKIKCFFKEMDKNKAYKLAAIIIGAIGVIAAVSYFLINCFHLSSSKKYNLYFALILIVMIAMTVYLVRLFIKEKEWSYSRVFLVLACGWSFAFQLVMPPISGADEVGHYYSAYHAANIIMGIKDHDFDTEPGNYGAWIKGTSYFEMRAEDYVMLPYVDVTFPYQYSVLTDTGNWFSCSEEGKAIVNCYEAPAKASRYLVTGTGIAIARTLGWGFSATIFMGRFMNSLVYIFLGWLCVRLLPMGKLQLVNFALFPTILELCASYSYDNLSIMFSILLLTLCIFYSQPNVKLHAWDLIILGGCAVILVPNKTVYVLFVIWILMIPLVKWWKDVVLSKKWYEYGLLAVLVAGAVVVCKKYLMQFYWQAYSLIVWKNENPYIEQDTSRESYTWQYILTHKWETFKFAMEGVKVDWWYNIKHIVGSELGHVKLNAAIPIACIIVLLAVLIVGIVISKGKRLKAWQYVIFAIGLCACLFAIFIGCLTRFTPLEGSERVQISYRYLIPLYMGLCVALGTDEKENKNALTLILIQNTTLMISACFLLEFLFHLRDGMPAPF